MSIVASKSELMQLREEMDEQSSAFETAPAGLIVAWAVDRFGAKLAMASSFQEAVLIDIAVAGGPDHRGGVPRHRFALSRDPGVRRDHPVAAYDLNLTVTQPVAGAGAVAVRHAPSAASSGRSAR